MPTCKHGYYHTFCSDCDYEQVKQYDSLVKDATKCKHGNIRAFCLVCDAEQAPPEQPTKVSYVAKANEMAKQAIKVLSLAPHYGVYNEVGFAELRQAVCDWLDIPITVEQTLDAVGWQAFIAPYERLLQEDTAQPPTTRPTASLEATKQAIREAFEDEAQIQNGRVAAQDAMFGKDYARSAPLEIHNLDELVDAIVAKTIPMPILIRSETALQVQTARAERAEFLLGLALTTSLSNLALYRDSPVWERIGYAESRVAMLEKALRDIRARMRPRV